MSTQIWIASMMVSSWDLTWLVDKAPFENIFVRKAAVVVAIMVVAWLLGIVISAIIRGIGARLHNDEEGSTVLTLISATIRAVIVVLGGLLASQAAGLPSKHLVETFGIQALSALAILITGWFIAGWLANNVRAMGENVSRRNARVDKTLFSFVASLIKYVLVTIAIVVALTQFGFQTNSLVAVIGAAGLAIALALQDTLKGVAAGFMLASFRPYRLGDFIEVGDEKGTVIDITPFTTTLKTITNATVVLPNNLAWGNVITNFTTDPKRRVDLYFSISYDDDMSKAINIITETCAKQDLLLNDPPPWVGVFALSDWSVDIRCRAWCNQADFVEANAALTRDVKLAFDANGITIPYPHQVEIHQASGNDG